MATNYEDGPMTQRLRATLDAYAINRDNYQKFLMGRPPQQIDDDFSTDNLIVKGYEVQPAQTPTPQQTPDPAHCLPDPYGRPGVFIWTEPEPPKKVLKDPYGRPATIHSAEDCAFLKNVMKLFT